MSGLKDLPLEQISETLAGFFVWWDNLTEGVPAQQLPLIVYVVGCVLVLLLWLVVMRIIPRPIKGISFALVAAVLFAPGQAAGEVGEIAPAMLGVFHGILMKDFAAATAALVPILMVFAALLVIGAIWQFLRSVIAADEAKKAETARIQAEKQRLAQEAAARVAAGAEDGLKILK